MNLQTKTPTTADEFLRWNEGREGKREFVRGRVVEMMAGVSKNHLIIVTNLMHQLSTQLGLRAYIVGAAEFGVRTAEGIRYPDVFVERKAGYGSDLAAMAPLLIAEVLSPSSYNRDFGEKVVEYSGIPSLLYYLILSQDEPRAWLWSRGDDDSWSDMQMIAGLQEEAVLSRLDVKIRFEPIYEGLLGPEVR